MLLRFDPLREMEQLLSPFGASSGAAAMDVYRQGDELIVDMDLPGVDRDAITLTAERNVLQVAARRAPRWREQDQVLVAERPTGEVTRRLTLGDGLDPARIDASYDAGVLRLRIPLADEARPHRIPVRLGGEAHAVEGTLASSQEDAGTAAERSAERVGDAVAMTA